MNWLVKVLRGLLGLFFLVMTIVISIGTLTIFLTPAGDAKNPALFYSVGFLMLIGCLWLFKVSLRFIIGSKAGGGLISSTALYVIGFLFLSFPVIGFYTGYYEEHGWLSYIQGIMYIFFFLGIMSLARERKSISSIRDEINQYTKSIKTNPQDWTLIFKLGVAHQSIGETEEAYQAFKKAYDMAPSNIDVIIEYISETIKTERIVEAKNIIESVKTLFPNQMDIKFYDMIVYILLGEQEKAIQVGKTILEMNPDHEEVQFYISIAESINNGNQKQPESFQELMEFA